MEKRRTGGFYLPGSSKKITAQHLADMKMDLLLKQEINHLGLRDQPEKKGLEIPQEKNYNHKIRAGKKC